MGTYDRNHADPPSCAFSEIETSTASPFAISICVGKLIVFALCMRNAPWEKASRQSAPIRLMKSRPGPYRLESFDLDAYGMKARFSKSSDNPSRSSAGTGASTYFCERAALAMSWRSASHKRPSFICCSSIEVSLTLNQYRRNSLGFAPALARRYSARKSMAYWAASAAPFFRTLSSTV